MVSEISFKWLCISRKLMRIAVILSAIRFFARVISIPLNSAATRSFLISLVVPTSFSKSFLLFSTCSANCPFARTGRMI